MTDESIAAVMRSLGESNRRGSPASSWVPRGVPVSLRLL